MTITARVAAVALAIGVIGTACSGSTKPASTASTGSASSVMSTAPSITKADFLAKAQQLCDKYNNQIRAIGGGAHDPATRNADANAILGLVRQHVADARALGYPPGDRSVLEPIWNDMDAAAARLQRTKDHPNIQQEIGAAFGPDIDKLTAYGTC